MKFLPLEAAYQLPDKAELEQEYRAAEDFMPARAGEKHFFFKSGFRVYAIPYARITRVFRRVEIVNARMGCCNNGLPVENIVLCGEGEKELVQIRFQTERLSKATLEELTKRCPHAEIGYVRAPDQKTAVRQV